MTWTHDNNVKVVMKLSDTGKAQSEAINVLLAEDNKINNQLIAKELLKKHGYTIAIAGNCQ